MERISLVGETYFSVIKLFYFVSHLEKKSGARAHNRECVEDEFSESYPKLPLLSFHKIKVTTPSLFI